MISSGGIGSAEPEAGIRNDLIAHAGAAITGIDGSHQMLERCRAKLAAESREVQARVHLAQHDMRDFVLGTTFSLIIAPFRVVQHLTTPDDQLRFLAAVSRHLAPGGRLVFDVFNPRFDMLMFRITAGNSAHLARQRKERAV